MKAGRKVFSFGHFRYFYRTVIQDYILFSRLRLSICTIDLEAFVSQSDKNRSFIHSLLTQTLYLQRHLAFFSILSIIDSFKETLCPAFGMYYYYWSLPQVFPLIVGH